MVLAAHEVDEPALVVGLLDEGELPLEPQILGLVQVGFRTRQRLDPLDAHRLRQEPCLPEQSLAHLAVGPPHHPPRVQRPGGQDDQEQDGCQE